NMLALLFVDINDFKAVNDTHGHAVGDRVLKTIARRLESCVRETDTVTRMGGDEFAVLLTDIQSADAVAMKAKHIAAEMAGPLGADLAAIAMPSCSIGIACYPADGQTADDLLRQADNDMYRRKGRRQHAD